jgi:predicted transcriptional regulator
MGTFTPTTLDLLATIQREQPGSINEAARAVERDVKNVHEQLTPPRITRRDLLRRGRTVEAAGRVVRWLRD